MFKKILADISAIKQVTELNPLMIILSNRGFHALLFYRIAYSLQKMRIPILPMLFSRTIQVLYGIDIDSRAQLDGGIVIMHGVGLVIGLGCKISSHVILFHGVTLGRKGVGPVISSRDGFPVVESHCTIGAGAKLLGAVTIGHHSFIGANCVVTNNIPAHSTVKMPEPLIYSKPAST